MVAFTHIFTNDPWGTLARPATTNKTYRQNIFKFLALVFNIRLFLTVSPIQTNIFALFSFWKQSTVPMHYTSLLKKRFNINCEEAS